MLEVEISTVAFRPSPPHYNRNKFFLFLFFVFLMKISDVNFNLYDLNLRDKSRTNGLGYERTFNL